MDEAKEIKDEILEDKGLQVSNGNIFPFERAKKYNLIPKVTIKKIDVYLRPIIYRATQNRKVNVEKILENAEFMFMKGRYDDDMWIQHCASSFREILVFVNPLHFHEAYQNIPEPNNPSIEKALLFLKNACTFLSSIVHHRPSQLMGDAETLYPSQGYGQLTEEQFLKKQDEFFEELCIDVVYTLDLIFSKYCIAQKENK